MSSRSAERLGAVALVAALLVVHAPAAADDAPPQAPDAAMAQSLFDAGRELATAGKYGEACPKFEASNQLDPSAGTLLNLGKCHEALGRTASAWAAYRQALSVGRSKGQARQVTAAEEFLAAIEPRLSRLTVAMPAPTPGARVTRAGVALDAAALGVPIAVDPGRFAIVVEAPGHEPWSREVEVVGDGAAVVVEVPRLTPAREIPPDPPPPPPPEPEGGVDPWLVGALAGGGVGVVGLGLGAIFGAAALGSASTAEEDPALCPGRRCTPEGLAFVDDARTEATVADVAFVIGGLGLAAGGVCLGMWLASEEPARVAVAPLVGPGVGGVVIGGTL